MSPTRTSHPGLRRLIRRRRRPVRVQGGPGPDTGFGPPEAGVREPRRPKPNPPALAEALDEPAASAR